MVRFTLALVLTGILTLLPAASWAGGALAAAVVGGKLTVAASGAAVAPVAAGALIFSASGRTDGFGAGLFSGPAYLIVEATPLAAQVFLDGHLLGTARQLIARALQVVPGRHAVEIVSPGYKPYVAQFVVDPSFPARIRVALLPE